MSYFATQAAWIRYGLAALTATLAALAVHYVPIIRETGHGEWFLFFFATAISAICFGLYPALLSICLSLVGINILVLASDWITHPFWAIALNLAFCFLSGLIIGICHSQQKFIKVLSESQQDLYLAQAVAQTGSWRFNVPRNELRWSPETYRIFAIPKGTAVTCETFFAAVHPEDMAHVKEASKTALSGQAYDIEHRIIVGGVVKWIHERAVLEFSKDRELLGGFGTTQDITQRKQAEISLREQRNEIQLIMDLTPNLVAYLNPDFRYLRINKTYETWWNKKPEQILGHEVREIVGERNWGLIRPNMERARSGEAVSFDHQSDVYRWVHVDYVPDIDTAGNVKGIVVQVANISEHKLAEQKLFDTEQRMRLATTATGVGIWEWDLATNQIYWDKQMFRIFGIPPTKDGLVEYAAWINTILPEDVQEQEQLLQETIRTRELNCREFRIKRPDEKGIRHIEAVEIVRTNAQGKPEWLIGTNLDITERKHAEMGLIERENQLRLIMNLTPALISYLDTDFRYVRANKTYEDWFDVTVKDIIGHTVREIVGEATWKIAGPHLEKARAGESASYENNITFRNNVIRWVKATFVPDIDANGVVKGIVAHVADIDERKQAEQQIALLNQALQDRINEMQAIFNTAPIGLAIANDTEGGHIRGNATLEQMMGLPWHGEFSLRVLPPNPYQVFVNGNRLTVDELPIQWAIRGETVTDQVLEIHRHDGQIVSLLGNSKPLLDENNAVRGAVGAFLDVTKFRVAESALKDSKERLRLAQQAGALGVFDQDLVSGEMQWDGRIRELWGVKSDGPVFIGTYMAGVHPDDRALVKAAVQRSFDPQGNGEYHAEYRIIRPTDGRTFWLAAFGITTFANGKPSRLIGFVQDISERKLAEAKLRDTELRLTLAMEALNAGYWDWELEGNKVYYSRVWKQQLGFEDHELPNEYQEWVNRLHPDDRDYVLAAVESHLNNYIPNYEIEFRLRHKDGSYRWIHSRAALTHDQNKRLIRMVGIHLDITDFKKAKELNRQRKTLDETSQLHVASQTAAAIAHELNQPLIAAAYFADAAVAMLQDSNTEPKKLIQTLETCSQQVHRAGKVIPQLLCLLYKGETAIEQVNINRVLGEIRQLIDTEKLFDIFKIKLMLGNGLPPVKANQLQLQKILLNIVHNGLESMLDSGINSGTLTVTTCRSADDPGMLQLTVSDEGPGVSDDGLLKKMFQPFYTTKTNGLGMELTISRSLVEAYGGQIWAEKNAGTGISVNLTLPFMR